MWYFPLAMFFCPWATWSLSLVTICWELNIMLECWWRALDITYISCIYLSSIHVQNMPLVSLWCKIHSKFVTLIRLISFWLFEYVSGPWYWKRVPSNLHSTIYFMAFFFYNEWMRGTLGCNNFIWRLARAHR